MAKVKFTAALKRFFPSLAETSVEAGNVHDVIKALEKKYPGFSGYIVDDTGQLRQHVNVFVKDHLVKDRVKLSDPVSEEDEVLIFQALSGG